MAWVLEPTNQLLLHFVDYNGIRATSQYFIASGETNPSGGAALAIADGAQGISNDGLVATEILRHASWDAAVTPTDGPYPRPADKVKMTFTASDGSKVIMQIPAPNETILKPDHYKADPSDSALAAFIAYVEANCLSEEGAPITQFSGGYRRRPPRRKKQ